MLLILYLVYYRIQFVGMGAADEMPVSHWSFCFIILGTY